MRKTSFVKKHSYVLILLFFLLFHIVNHYLWLEADARIVPYRYPYQFTRILYHYFLTHPSIETLKFVLGQNDLTPPFYPFSIAVVNFFFGVSADVTQMANIVYLVLLLLSIYHIGRKLATKGIGLLAAFIFSMYPVTFKWLREFRITIPLSALVALSVCFLIYSNSFAKRNYSLLLGVSMGVGSLINWAFPIFLIGPIVYAIFRIAAFKKDPFTVNQHIPLLRRIRNRFREKRKQLLNLCLSLFIAFLITSPWYLPYASLERIFYIGFLDESRGASPLYYLFHLARDQINLFYFAVFLIVIPFFLRSKIRMKFSLFLWILIPLLFLPYLRTHDPRYVVPFIPAIALISSGGILELRKVKVKKLLVGMMVIIGLTGFYFFSYEGQNICNKPFLKTPWGNFSLLSEKLFSPPAKQRGKKLMEEIFEVVSDNSSNLSKPVLITVIPNYQIREGSALFYILNDVLLVCYSYTTGLPFSYSYHPPLPFSFKSGGYFPPLDISGSQRKSDFLVICGDPKIIKSGYPKFQLLKKVDLENEMPLLILKKKD